MLGLANCVAHIRAAHAGPVVVLGFSQGASQAWRMAWVSDSLNISGVIAIGGDIPPELSEAQLPASVCPALIIRGTR